MGDKVEKEFKRHDPGEKRKKMEQQAAEQAEVQALQNEEIEKKQMMRGARDAETGARRKRLRAQTGSRSLLMAPSQTGVSGTLGGGGLV